MLIHGFSLVNARLLKAFGKAFYAIIKVDSLLTPLRMPVGLPPQQAYDADMTSHWQRRPTILPVMQKINKGKKHFNIKTLVKIITK